MKRLYLISQRVKRGYDTYDSAVVVASSLEEAKMIHPNGDLVNNILEDGNYGSWANTADQVSAEYLGVYRGDLGLNSVICASFNAG